MRENRMLARSLALLSAALISSGCPALLDDDFEIISLPDASLGGGAGAGGASGAGGSSAQAGAGGNAAYAGLDGGGADGGCNCAPGDTCCDDQCVDTSSNYQHCAACGTGCPGTTCMGGQCTNQCLFGWLDCDQNIVTGCEVNAANDPDNCGNCGTRCAFDQTCESGKCTCPAGSANCNGELPDGCEVSISSDPSNCGGCGASCGPNQDCDDASCTCQPGFADCNLDANDGCEVNLATSAQHCGACNQACGANGVCAGKQCGCAPGFLNCDGQLGCEAAATSPLSCGNCAVQCGGSSPVCDGTACVPACGSGEQLCGGSCVSFATDPLHCGACDSPVGPNQKCVAGLPACAPGWGNCNAQPGCETDLTSDKANCGSCGNACKPGSICSDSKCTCAASTPNDCGSACRECCGAAQCSDGDPCTVNSCTAAGSCSFSAHCPNGGNCCPALGCFECCNDSQCSGGKVCSNNQCVLPTCVAPEILCGTVCINPNTSASNCGSCGNVCGAGRTCSGGECTPKWVATAAPGGFAARAKAASAFIPSTSSVFIWGGQGAGGALDSGALYNLGSNAWSAVPTTASTPSARVLATAVWTGQVVVVWGGGDVANTADYATGAVYDPETGVWTPMATAGAPSARRAPYAVYTGSRVLFWGGFNFAGLPTQGAHLYDPVLNEWNAASTGSQPSATLHATVGWSGARFFVFGGLAAKSLFDFHVYEPAGDDWTKLPNGSSERHGAFGGWDGSYFVAWGGRKEGGGSPQEWSDGRRYNPAGGWSTLSPAPASMTARHVLHRQSGWSARISGGNLLLIGGVDAAGTIVKNGAIYNSTTNTWSTVPAWPSGEDRRFAIGVWAGSELVLWGGLNGSAPSASGERFRP
jgi:hypothetical protein